MTEELLLKRVRSSTGELCSYLCASLCSGSRPQTSGLRMKVGVTSTCWTARRSRTSSSWRGAWVSCCFSADIHWWRHRVNSSTNLQLCFLQVRVRQAGHPQRPHWQHRTYWKQTSYLHVSITWLSCRQVSTGEQPERSRWISVSEIQASVLQVELTERVRRPQSEAQHGQHLLLQERYARLTCVASQTHLFTSCSWLCWSVSVDVPFQEYVDEFLRPQSADALGSGES